MKVNYLYNKTRRSFKKGMTLLEIVIVLGIIALIMAFVVPNVTGVFANAKDVAAASKAQSISTALASYRMAGGRYPTQNQGLKALITKPSSAPTPKRWKQLLPSMPLDPWDNEYIYKYPGSKDKNSPEVISKGEDGELGTDDDISSQDEL